jgi:mRNA interferase MazF
MGDRTGLARMKRGEIRWYRFRAPGKRRPVLVLTRDSVLEYLGEVTVASITSAIRDIPSEVVLDPDDGVPQPCAINLDHLQTVSKDRLGGLVATLPSARMVEVRDALLFALGY